MSLCDAADDLFNSLLIFCSQTFAKNVCIPYFFLYEGWASEGWNSNFKKQLTFWFQNNLYNSYLLYHKETHMSVTHEDFQTFDFSQLDIEPAKFPWKSKGLRVTFPQFAWRLRWNFIDLIFCNITKSYNKFWSRSCKDIVHLGKTA